MNLLFVYKEDYFQLIVQYLKEVFDSYVCNGVTQMQLNPGYIIEICLNNRGRQETYNTTPFFF